MLVDPEQKRKTIGCEESPGKAGATQKRKTKKETVMEALQAPEETQQQPASSSAAASSADMPKKTITNPKYEPIAPSTIGIQRLREEFEEAKNKDILRPADVAFYNKLYNEWRAA